MFKLKKSVNRTSKPPLQELNNNKDTRENAILILPDEILVNIISYVNQRDVLNFILVNKRFHRSGIRKLYHSIYLGSRVTSAGYVYTPFYINHTVVHNYLLFRNNVVRNKILSKLVIRVYAENCDELQYTVLVNELPWAKIILENCNNLSIIHKFKDFRHCGSLNISAGNSHVIKSKLEQSNYSIRKLIIELDKDIWKLLTCLKRLCSLHIFQARPDILKELEDLEMNEINVEELYLSIYTQPSEDYQINHLQRLDYLFNLSKIITFGIHISYYNKPVYYDLKWLFEKLLQLSNLYLDCYLITPKELPSLLRENSLTSLYFHEHKNDAFSSRDNIKAKMITQIIQNQSDSLTCLSLSDDSVSSWLTTGANFDKVEDLSYSFCSIGRKQGINIVGKLIGMGKKFPKLNTIVFNDVYHLIERLEDEVIIRRLN